MSERKVLTKYYPPDFDPSAIGRTRKPKDAVVKLPTVRLMAPFSHKCLTCGEYIYKGRKFNARKEVTDETYYNVKVIRFYIRCTRCSAELTFKTDPRNNDYAAEKGMSRSFEPWREAQLAEETEEERLDRLEREEAERDPMKELEQKAADQQREMEIQDKLDDIRRRNALRERVGKDDVDVPQRKDERDLERERLDREDEEAAKRAFQGAAGEKVRRLKDEDADEGTPKAAAVTGGSGSAPSEAAAAVGNSDAQQTAAMPPPTFVPKKKRKQDFGAALGIKKKKPEAQAV